MIFLSHTSKDKSIVEPIAIKLATIYGQDKVFYDSWAIQPGDGIIDKMNYGINQMNFFFFFVSRNSLNSSMVKLEWQNALYKSLNNKCKFIAIKIDDCQLPEIIQQNLYIDFYNYGFDVGFAQMVDVIDGKNTFHKTSQNFENVLGVVKRKTDYCFEIEIKTLHFQEPISRFIVLFDNKSDDINLNVTTDSFHTSSKGDNIELNNGQKYNYYSFGVSRATTPTFPVRITIETISKEKLLFRGLMRATSEKEYKGIPYQYTL